MKKEMGKRIENIRNSMGMTKEEFSKLLGISGQYLGIVERGKSCLSYEKLKALCEVSNLSSDYILFGKNLNIKKDTKNLLSEFSDTQIETACNTLQTLALFIKNKQFV